MREKNIQNNTLVVVCAMSVVTACAVFWYKSAAVVVQPTASLQTGLHLVQRFSPQIGQKQPSKFFGSLKTPPCINSSPSTPAGKKTTQHQKRNTSLLSYTN